MVAVQNNTASAVPKFYFLGKTVTIRQNYLGTNHCSAICCALLVAITKTVGYGFASALLTCVFFTDENNVLTTFGSFLLELGGNALEMSCAVGLAVDAVALRYLLDRAASETTRFASDGWIKRKFFAMLWGNFKRGKEFFEAHGFPAEVDCRKNQLKNLKIPDVSKMREMLANCV